MNTKIHWHRHPKRGFNHYLGSCEGAHFEIQPVRHGPRILFVLAREGRLVASARKLEWVKAVAKRFVRTG